MFAQCDQRICDGDTGEAADKSHTKQLRSISDDCADTLACREWLNSRPDNLHIHTDFVSA